MKKLNIGVLVGMFFLVALPSIVQSCCRETMKLSSEYRFDVYALVEDQLVATDTINSDFELEISFYWEMATATHFNALPSAYATSCETTIVNELLENGIAITLNAPITFDQQLIEPGTDLLSFDVATPRRNLVRGNFVRLYFSKNFIDRMELTPGSYVLQLTAETTDGTQLSAERQVYIDL